MSDEEEVPSPSTPGPDENALEQTDPELERAEESASLASTMSRDDDDDDDDDDGGEDVPSSGSGEEDSHAKLCDEEGMSAVNEVDAAANVLEDKVEEEEKGDKDPSCGTTAEENAPHVAEPENSDLQIDGEADDTEAHDAVREQSNTADTSASSACVEEVAREVSTAPLPQQKDPVAQRSSTAYSSSAVPMHAQESTTSASTSYIPSAGSFVSANVVTSGAVTSSLSSTDRKMELLLNELEGQVEAQRRQLDSYRNHVRMKHQRLSELSDELSDLEALTLRFSFGAHVNLDGVDTPIKRRVMSARQFTKEQQGSHGNSRSDVKRAGKRLMQRSPQLRMPSPRTQNLSAMNVMMMAGNDMGIGGGVGSTGDDIDKELVGLLKIEDLEARHADAAEHVLHEVYRGKCYEQIEKRIKGDLQSMRKVRESLSRRITGIETQLELQRVAFKKAELAKSKAIINTRNARKTTYRYRQSLKHRIEDVRRQAKAVSQEQEREQKRREREKRSIENLIKRKHETIEKKTVSDLCANVDANGSGALSPSPTNDEDRTKGEPSGTASEHTTTGESMAVDAALPDAQAMQEDAVGDEKGADDNSAPTSSSMDTNGIDASAAGTAPQSTRDEEVDSKNVDRSGTDYEGSLCVADDGGADDRDEATSSASIPTADPSHKTTGGEEAESLARKEKEKTTSTSSSQKESTKRTLQDLGVRDVNQLSKKYLEQRELHAALDDSRIIAASKVQATERILERAQRELADLRNEGSQTSRRRQVDSLDYAIAESEKRCAKYKRLYSGTESTLTEIVLGFQSIWDLMRQYVKDLPPTVIAEHSGTSGAGSSGDKTTAEDEDALVAAGSLSEPQSAVTVSGAGETESAGRNQGGPSSSSTLTHNLLMVVSMSEIELSKILALVNT